MYNWAGKFNFIILFLYFSGSIGWAIEKENVHLEKEGSEIRLWETFEKKNKGQIEKDYKNGLSYIISGSIAFVGGMWGERLAQDALEKGTYALFQTLGVASVGYGAYLWTVGSDERFVYESLNASDLTTAQKTQFIKGYRRAEKERQMRDRLIRAITHGLIAGLNLYNGVQAKDENIRNTLYFIGGVNVLAGASIVYEF